MPIKVGYGAAALGLLVAATYGGLGTNNANAADWEPEFVYGVLQPLPDGFPNGPLTLIAAGDETSVTGLLARKIAEYSTIFKPVDINVVYRPDFEKYGSWEALKYAAGAEGGADGYLNVIFASPDDIISLHTTDVAKDLGVGLDDLSEVISLEDHRYAVIQCKEAGWEPTWAGLVQQIKDHPGAVRYAGGESGDRLDLTFADYMQAEGLGSLYDKAAINSANTGDVGARAAAVAGCEADVTVTDMDQLITQQMGDKVDVILVSGTKRLGKYKEAPTATEAGIADDNMSRTMQLVVPASVDPLHVKWLNTLWNKTAHDSYFKAGRVLDQALNTALALDAEASAAVNDMVDKDMDALTRELGINVAQ